MLEAIKREKNKSLNENITKIPKSLQDIIGNINLPNDNANSIVRSLNNNKLLGSSDGSIIQTKDKTTGGHAYSLRDWDSDQGLITGYNATPYSTNMTSLTAELYGILATVITLLILTITHSEEIQITARIIITSDNKQAIKMANNYQTPINITETLQPEYDLQVLLHQIIELIPVNIQFTWVKGHQDQNSQGETIHGPFLREIYANIDMDKLAGHASKTSIELSPRRHTYSTTVMGTCNKQGDYIGNLKDHLLLQSRYKPLWNYLRKKTSGMMK